MLQVFPKRRTSSGNGGSASSGGGGGGGGFGGLLGGIGRRLKEATDGVGGLLNDCGIGNSPRPAGGKGEGAWTTEWMKMCAPVLADLRLSDMSLPGTHDSGTAKMVRGGDCVVFSSSYFGWMDGEDRVKWARRGKRSTTPRTSSTPPPFPSPPPSPLLPSPPPSRLLPSLSPLPHSLLPSTPFLPLPHLPSLAKPRGGPLGEHPKPQPRGSA